MFQTTLLLHKWTFVYYQSWYSTDLFTEYFRTQRILT